MLCLLSLAVPCRGFDDGHRRPSTFFLLEFMVLRVHSGTRRHSLLTTAQELQRSGPSFPRVRTLELSLECAQDRHLVSNILSEDDDVKTGNAAT